MKKTDKLGELRKKIDAIDVELLKLLNKRASIAIQVGKTKLKEKSDFYSPERERAIYKRLKVKNKGPVPDKAVRNIFREIISASLSLEKPLKIAFLGPEATFTHQAALRHFGMSGKFMPKSEISGVFDDVERGKVDFGVIPVESSAEGAVTHTLDMFVRSNLKICAEVMLKVSLALLSKSGKANKITRVCSHPHALAQCSKWLKAHMPNMPTFEVNSTAMAAEMASVEPGTAAISSEAAANVYDLRMVETKIEDNPNNYTRFLVIGKKESKRSGKDKTSLMFAIKDSSGALYKMLGTFAKRKINLTKIESRPLRTKAWEYVFFVDLDGHISEKKVKDSLTDLGKMCSFIKVLGSYPRGG